MGRKLLKRTFSQFGPLRIGKKNLKPFFIKCTFTTFNSSGEKTLSEAVVFVQRYDLEIWAQIWASQALKVNVAKPVPHCWAGNTGFQRPDSRKAETKQRVRKIFSKSIKFPKFV